MLILALDTSGDVCSVAVTDDQNLLAEYSFAHSRKLTERLPGVVEFVLKEVGTSLDEIEVFAVGIGPGSFTGVRVGVTMAKTWAEVFQKPLVGISTLDALNAAVARHDEAPVTVVAVAPSRRGEVIAAFYRPPGHDVDYSVLLAPPETLPTDRVVARARELAPERPVLVVGEAAAFTAVEEATCWAVAPLASEIARLAYLRRLADEADDPATLVPLYVAPPPIRDNQGKIQTR
jgi:tRNA threonylcarbamoyladenosine biosynthesis protein TsaB